MKIRSYAAAVLVACAIVGTTYEAKADSQSEAKDLFSHARDLRKAGDCGQAVPLFRRAYTLYPQGLGTLRNIAECEEQLGHFASSRRAWLDLKRALIAQATPNPDYHNWDTEADEAATRLKPKVAELYVDITLKTPDSEGPANDKSGVDLVINGENLGPSLVGVPIDRDPGTYTVRVQTADAAPAEQPITLAAGDNKHMSFRLVKTPKPKPGEGTMPPPGADSDADARHTRRNIGWILTGVGGAALITGGVTLLLRQSAKSDLEDKCGGDIGNCTYANKSEAQNVADRGKTMSTLTTIFGIGGAVFVAAGVTLVLINPTNVSSGGLQVTPTVGGLDLTGRF
jgi:hypothetical protein